jgi:hypothetical protein
MKKILLFTTIFLFLLSALYLPSKAFASNCVVDVSKNPMLSGDNPEIHIKNNHSKERNFGVRVKRPSGPNLVNYEKSGFIQPGETKAVQADSPLNQIGVYTLEVYFWNDPLNKTQCSVSLTVTDDPDEVKENDPDMSGGGGSLFYKPKECVADKFVDHPDVETIDDYQGIVTAIGCVPTRPQLFIYWLLNRVISIGGGIAFLIMIWGVFQIMTSSGDPEKLQKGKEIMVSAGAGLLFIIFSTFLLELIGVNILKIPGWGG